MRRGTPRKLALGLATAMGMLVLLELGVRLVAGPPHPPMVASIPDDSEFLVRDMNVVRAAYQEPELPPFSATAGDRPRVLWLGGSSVHGAWGMAPERQAASVLMGLLDVESINLGSPGIDSTHLVELLPQALTVEPDAIVLYTGHNDFGNAVFTGAWSERAQLTIALASWARHSRVFELLSLHLSRPAAVRRVGSNDPVFRLDDHARDAIREGLEQRLVWLARSAREAGVPLILVTPVSNAWAPSVAWSCPEQIAALGEAARPKDPRTLPPQALEGDCRDLEWARAVAAGDRDTLDRLRDEDPLPTRADRATVDMIRRVADEEELLLIDANQSFRERGQGLEPKAWFTDNLHLNGRGHKALAELVAPPLEDLLWP